jgi:hypothetical protein
MKEDIKEEIRGMKSETSLNDHQFSNKVSEVIRE